MQKNTQRKTKTAVMFTTLQKIYKNKNRSTNNKTKDINKNNTQEKTETTNNTPTTKTIQIKDKQLTRHKGHQKTQGKRRNNLENED